MSSTADLVTDALAVARITGLITADRVPFGAWREGVIATAREDEDRVNAVREAEGLEPVAPSYLAELVECPWCASMWVAASVFLVARRIPGWRTLSRVLAASQVAGMLAHWSRD